MRIVCSLLLFLFLGPALLSAAEVNRKQCASTINMYCTLCHTTGRICRGLRKNDSDAWKKILQRMSDNNEDIDAGVRKTVHACLTSLPSVKSIVCPQ